jgi:zinc transport system permease protein
LLAITVHEDLARAEGVRAILVRITFMVLIALVIAVAMKIVGILLITALSIIPAAAARRFSRSPEGMAILAAVNGILAVIMGISGSLAFDTPAGPSIVVAATAIFLFSQLPLFKVAR